MQRVTLFVDVILPLAVPLLYTYRVPFEWNPEVEVGRRVLVQFGKKKLYTAIIHSVHETAPASYAAKYIESVLDPAPVVNFRQLELWQWMAEYYMCTTGEVMNAALPSGLRLSSETKLILNPAFGENHRNLTDKEYLIVEALELQHMLSLADVSAILEQKTSYTVIKSLLEKGAILIHEEIKEKYKPKTAEFVRLQAEANQEKNLEIILGTLEKKAYKQLELVMMYLKLSGRYSASAREVKKNDLLKASGASTSVLSELVKKNILEIYTRETGRFSGDSPSENTEKALNTHQTEAYKSIKEQLERKDVVLLHGVTSSGKTELYIKLIAETLQQDKQVLYLLPEIALTTQIITRLQNFFGNQVCVYHSKFNENERIDVWKNILAGTGDTPFRIILGARSSIFLPFSNLGLIIVDEEHDTSYKQYDPAPRYHARDTAIFLGHIHGSKIVLGSATPSMESYYNAQTGKYGLTELNYRFGGIEMPAIEVVDIKEESRKKRMKSHFSSALLENIDHTLANKEQVILFQNRRGFVPRLECNRCGWIPQCTHCDISLTYHKSLQVLRCHYCGYSTKPPSCCEACGDVDILMKGLGTEKIEEELGVFFPQAKIARMDLDTTRAKHAHRQLIQNFEEQRIDILVGTQMVTKGLDFDHVSLVGILQADSLLHFPDFRAYERSFQLMAQVSGRAGRKNKRGKVLIQTQHPDHIIIKHVLANDFNAMYLTELKDRKEFHYPPFCRLIQVTLKCRGIELLNEGAKELADVLRKKLGKRILGPEFPLVSRIRNEYLKTILVKAEREISVSKVKQVLREEVFHFRCKEAYRSIKVHIDVDPA